MFVGYYNIFALNKSDGEIPSYEGIPRMGDGQLSEIYHFLYPSGRRQTIVQWFLQPKVIY